MDDMRREGGDAAGPPSVAAFQPWLGRERRAVVLGGGQSRRLPAYAAGGGEGVDAAAPPPRATASGMDETLLSLQAPALRAVLEGAPPCLNTLVASGDVLLHPARPQQHMGAGASAGAALRRYMAGLRAPHAGGPAAGPAHGSSFAGVWASSAAEGLLTGADVVCFGVPRDALALRSHGVFFTFSGHNSGEPVSSSSSSSRTSAGDLAFMLQKPPPSLVHAHLSTGRYVALMDVGLWLLSARAVRLLRDRARGCPSTPAREAVAAGAHAEVREREMEEDRLRFYDLYSDFGCSLGSEAHRHGRAPPDEALQRLAVRVLPLPDVEFLHFGTTRELLTSTLALSARVGGQAPPATPGSLLPALPLGVEDEVCGGEEAGGGLRTAQQQQQQRMGQGRHAHDSASAHSSPSCATALCAQPPLWVSASHPTIVIQNSVLPPLSSSSPSSSPLLGASNTHIWVENSYIGGGWKLHERHVITGVPENAWAIELPPGACLAVSCVAAPQSLETPSAGGSSSSSPPPSVAPAASASDAAPAPQPVRYVARPYGFDDTFRGCVATADDDSNSGSAAAAAAAEEEGVFMGQPLSRWLHERCLTWRDVVAADLPHASADVDDARLFPCFTSVADMGVVVAWMVGDPAAYSGEALADCRARQLWLGAPRLSAAAIRRLADPHAAQQQRRGFQRRLYKAVLSEPTPPRDSATGVGAEGDRWPSPTLTPAQSAFFECLDLDAAARQLVRLGVRLPHLHAPLSTPPRVAPADGAALRCARQHMFAATYLSCLAGDRGDGSGVAAAQQHDAAAFTALCRAVTGGELAVPGSGRGPVPHLAVFEDQIVWARSPARVDLAGGWTDTPPYSLLHGGAVVNAAVELNGQPPVQVYVRLAGEPQIVLRSLDCGAAAVLRTYEDIRQYAAAVGSPFSISRAALALAGFLPEFCGKSYPSLAAQLADAFGGRGLELTVFVAIPAGSGLGTSSIVAGTALAALSTFCGLRWDVQCVCGRTLALEQLLTTGGGWQDQYGGLQAGVKLVESAPGVQQRPAVRWLPEYIFTRPELRGCHLLFYTGITRTAKDILTDVARGVFLGESRRLETLSAMRLVTDAMTDAIGRGEFERYGALVGDAWRLNVRLDSGTCPPAVLDIMARVEPFVLGAKLTGAGGGGYLYMVARDAPCAVRIREELQRRPPNRRARFVDMTLSHTGIQVSTS